MLRWYWWRVNAWSEISAMIAAFVVSVSLQRLEFSGNNAVVFAKTALITTAATTVVWLATTLLTPPESDERLLKFYRRVRPPSTDGSASHGYAFRHGLIREAVHEDLLPGELPDNCWRPTSPRPSTPTRRWFLSAGPPSRWLTTGTRRTTPPGR